MEIKKEVLQDGTEIVTVVKEQKKSTSSSKK